MLHYFLNGLSVRCVGMLLCLLALVACGGGSSAKSEVGVLKGGAIQGIPLQLKGETSIFAGAFVGQDGVGTQATFNQPSAIASDGSNLYIADSLSNVIRKMVIATGAVTTLAGKAGTIGSADGRGTEARFANPAGIATDGTYLYVTDLDNGTIRKIEIATGSVSTLAGSPGIRDSVDGLGSAARFFEPRGIATDSYNLYVTDSGDKTIRKIVIATGEVTTLAGSPHNSTGSVDGVGATASFSSLSGIVTDGTLLYVCDSGNNPIRKVVIATGVVTTLAITQSPDSPFLFNFPKGITLDGTNLYLVDPFNVYKVVIATGEISQQEVIPESASWGWSLYLPTGIVSSGTHLYLTLNDDTLKRLTIATGEVKTVAGVEFSSQRVANVHDMISDGTYLYLFTASEPKIKKVNRASGAITTLVDLRTVDDSLGLAQLLSITADANNIYAICSVLFGNPVIFKVEIATGAATRLTWFPATDTEPLQAYFGPLNITTDGINIYLANEIFQSIHKIVIATGAETVLAGTLGQVGSADGIGPAASFNQLRGMATDGTYVYVADSGNSTIRQILISTGKVTTLAGSPGIAGSQDGPGAVARFNLPTAITTDGTSLYISDTGNHVIRKLLLASGEVTTIAGTAGVYGRVDAAGAAASFNFPASITTDGNSLFLVDVQNNSIREIR